MPTGIHRRRFIEQVGLGGLFSAAAGFRAASQSNSLPNILFIFTDDHALQAISAYGSKINQTPNIDRIAREGILFRNNFCCNSICAPSRAAVLTGKHSHMNGLQSNKDKFDGAQMTFPKLLQSVGYQTALIGKWHLVTDPTGFDHWEILPGQGNYYNPEFIAADGKQQYSGYVTDITTDLSLDWLSNQRDRNRPFLLMCQHKAPHRIWAPGPDHLTMYQGMAIPEPPTLFDDYSGRSPLAAQNEMEIGRHMMYDYDLKVPGLGKADVLGRDFPNQEYARMNKEQQGAWDAAYGPENEDFKRRLPTMSPEELVRWKYQRYIKDYLRCVASVDDNVGRLLDYLDESGLAEDTLVVYSSDQGFYLGEHGWYDKRWMYEESMRMPLTIRWPRVVTAGGEVEALTQNIDFAPTLLEVAGIKPPEEIQGASLAPFLRGGEPEKWRDALYYSYCEAGEHNVPPHEGVRTARHKLIHYYESREWELFDLEEDPQELNSVYHDSRYAAWRSSLTYRLEALKRQYGVPPRQG